MNRYERHLEEVYVPTSHEALKMLLELDLTASECCAEWVRLFADDREKGSICFKDENSLREGTRANMREPHAH